LASDLAVAFLVMLERLAPEERAALLDRFLAAVRAEDKEGILALVAEDVSWTSDGGGRVAAARNVIHGATRPATPPTRGSSAGRSVVAAPPGH
jgi:acyl-CoA reductase-like NAD-dependent aldehyde dehydrogenase